MIPLLFILLYALCGAHGLSCQMEQCYNAYMSTLEYESLPRTSSYRYCEVLNVYRRCLLATRGSCRGNFNFHSHEVVMGKAWRDLHCDHVFRQKIQHAESRRASNCRFLPASSHSFCSLFGDPHLVSTDGKMSTCVERGARTMIDNRFFLIQITSSSSDDDPLTTALSRVTVLVRSHACTRRVRFEASGGERLATAFTDGTTHSEAVDDASIRSVEVLAQSASKVEIRIRHCNTTIVIRKRAQFLSVSVRAPKLISEAPFTTHDANVPAMCSQGCLNEVSATSALLAPTSFSRCHAKQMRVPIKVATERCRSVNVTGAFFDACVYDLMFTGDENVVSLSADAESDAVRLSHIVRSDRREINTHVDISTLKRDWKCRPSLSPRHSLAIVIAIALLLL